MGTGGLGRPAAALLGCIASACAKDAPSDARRGQAPAPSSSTADGAVPDGPRLVSFPGGASLLADPTACTIALIGPKKAARWTRGIERCGGVLEIAVAPNSYAFARTGATLVAFSHEGEELWRIALGNVPRHLIAPAATLDSLVVTAASSSSLVAFEPTGKRAWKFDIDGGETIVAAPAASRTEGVLVTTTAAVYLVASDGNVRWRQVLPSTPRR